MSIIPPSLSHLTPWLLKCVFKTFDPCCITELRLPFKLHVTTDPRALADEQPLPEDLRRTSLLMRVLCFLAFGRPDLDDHWKSLQSEQAFETVRTRLCSILTNTITTVSCPTPHELNPALTCFQKGRRPPRYKWCFRHYRFACAIP
jgi:hypothetical protein